MANYITLNGVCRTPFAEESLTVSTGVVQFDAAKAAGSLMIRARLRGGPVRYWLTQPPTSTDGVPLYDADLLELAGPEIAALQATGGFILDAAATADATLYTIFYR